MRDQALHHRLRDVPLLLLHRVLCAPWAVLRDLDYFTVFIHNLVPVSQFGVRGVTPLCSLVTVLHSSIDLQVLGQGFRALLHDVNHLQVARCSEVFQQLLLFDFQSARVAGEQQLPAHLGALQDGDPHLLRLVEQELVPHEGGAGGEDHLVPLELRVVDVNGDVAEEVLLPQEVHLLQHGIALLIELEVQHLRVRRHGAAPPGRHRHRRGRSRQA